MWGRTEFTRYLKVTNANMRCQFIGRCVQVLGVVFLVSLIGCASAQDHVHRYAHPAPTLEEFTVCKGFGCRFHRPVSLDSSSWAEVVRMFEPTPSNAEEERARLGRAIALLEIKIGAMIGTRTDRPAAKTSESGRDQLDCIDETVNTTTYLRLLDQEGLMRWHRIGTPAQRGWLLSELVGSTNFITNTAVIVETATGASFAIDSYFYANGRPPKIMPLSEWHKNWRPSSDDPGLLPVL